MPKNLISKSPQEVKQTSLHELPEEQALNLLQVQNFPEGKQALKEKKPFQGANRFLKKMKENLENKKGFDKKKASPPNFDKENPKEKKNKTNYKNIHDLVASFKDSSEVTLDSSAIKMIKKANDQKRPSDPYINAQNSKGNIIDVRNVSKVYLNGNLGSRVLFNVNIAIKRGEFAVLLGKSGSGKSTLLNMISGLDRPTEGTIVVNNVSLPYLSNTKLTKFRRDNVSFIFQSYNLLENVTGYDNVETGAYLQKNKEKKLDIKKLFKTFELEDVMNKFPPQMSGGQKQRISILRALAKNSDIIFADEPTGALDEKTSLIVLEILHKINVELGTTIVMVTHNLDIKALANRVIYIRNGSVEKIETTTNPLKPSELVVGS